MDPAFYIEATREMVIAKPNGSLEFYAEAGLLKNSVTFGSQNAAVQFARDKGWREVPLAV